MAPGADSSSASQAAAPDAKQSRASRQAVEADNSGASPPAGAEKPNDSLMQAIRSLGRLPRETKTATQPERLLACRLRWAKKQGKLSDEQEAELAAISANHSGQPSLMQAIRSLGRLPKETDRATVAERRLAFRLRRARKQGQVSGEEEAELAAMSANHSGAATGGG